MPAPTPTPINKTKNEKKEKDTRSPFEFIQRGHSLQSENNFWGAADAFGEAAEVLYSLSVYYHHDDGDEDENSENRRDDVDIHKSKKREKHEKMSSLYLEQGREYLVAARDCLIAALLDDTNDEKKLNESIKNRLETDPVLSAQDKKPSYLDLSEEESRRRTSIFRRVFAANDVENKECSAISSSKDDYDERQFMAEERLAALNASLPPVVGSSSKGDLDQGMKDRLKRLGVELPPDYRVTAPVDSVSEENQEEIILALARDEYRMHMEGKPNMEGDHLDQDDQMPDNDLACEEICEEDGSGDGEITAKYLIQQLHVDLSTDEKNEGSSDDGPSQEDQIQKIIAQAKQENDKIDQSDEQPTSKEEDLDAVIKSNETSSLPQDSSLGDKFDESNTKADPIKNEANSTNKNPQTDNDNNNPSLEDDQVKNIINLAEKELLSGEQADEKGQNEEKPTSGENYNKKTMREESVEDGVRRFIGNAATTAQSNEEELPVDLILKTQNLLEEAVLIILDDVDESDSEGQHEMIQSRNTLLQAQKSLQSAIDILSRK